MKYILRISFILFTLVFIDYRAFSQLNDQPFDWDEYHKSFVSLRGLQFSPDGNSLLFTTRKADFQTNRWVNEYRLMNMQTRADSKMEFEEKGVRRIRWSPSGKYLSYSALKNGKLQIFIQEYPNGKAQSISNHVTSVFDFYWSPDESKIVFISEDVNPQKVEKEKFITAFEVGPHGYLEDRPYLSSHLYLLDIASGKEERLTKGSWTVSSGVSWSSDGNKITFTQKENAFSSNWHDNKIVLLDIASKTITPFSGNTGFEYRPHFLDDDKHFFFSEKTDKNPAGMTDYFIQIGNDKPVNLSKSIDRNIKSMDWVNAENRFLAYGQDGTLDGVWSISLKGESKKTSFSNLFSISNLVTNKKGETIMVASSGNQPQELFYVKNLSSKPVQLTKFNEVFKGKRLGKVETIEWKTDINMTTDGVVTYPSDFSASKKYPLVLLIHGGPTSSSSESFNPVAQQMANKGWIVFQPNYRGSNHRGDAFQEAIMNDGGEGPGRDVMAGIEILKQKGFIDESRIGVSGWSYGGFMTSWLIGRYPDVWKAAVSGAAPVDYTDMTSLTRMNLTLRHAITTSPWVGDNYKEHYAMSPMKNLSKIKVPTLVMSKVEDQIVSVTGSYKLYHALVANKVPSKFIAYPGGGHFPSDPANRKDVYDRWIAWLENYLNKPSANIGYKH